MKIINLYWDGQCEMCKKKRPEVVEVETENSRKMRLCYKHLHTLVWMTFGGVKEEEGNAKNPTSR